MEASTLETYEAFYDCKAKTGAFGIAGLISADEAFCNFFRIEGELSCRNIFQADKYIFLRLFDFHINSCSRKRIFYNVIQKILKDPVGLLTVQTKNHFFFRESGPELQTFFFELIFQLKFYLFKQIDDIHVHQIQVYILAACFADLKKVFDQDFQTHRFAFQNINIILSLFLIFLVFQQIHIGYDRSQRCFQIM